MTPLTTDDTTDRGTASQAPSSAGGPPRRSETERFATWAHWLSLAVAGALLLWLGRGHWFVADEWEFLTNRGVSGAALDLFVPHTQHWSTGPILFYRALVNVFGLQSYVPYLLGSIAVHLLVAHLAWRIAIRAGAQPWVATGLAALFLVADPMASSALFAFQISFEGSVAFGLWLLLLVDVPGPRGAPGTGSRAATVGRLVVIAVVAVVSLTFSSVSLPLVAAAGALALVRLGWRATALAFAPSALVFALWYELAGKRGLEGAGGMRVSGTVLRDLPSFVWDGLSSSVANPLRISGGTGSSLVLAALLVALGWMVMRRWDHRIAIALASGLGGLAFFSLTALGRASDGPTALRYLYIGGAMLLPVGALAISQLWRIDSVARWALGAALVVVLVLNTNALRHTANTELSRVASDRDHILAAAQVIRSGAAIPDEVYPELVVDPDLSIAKLRKLIASGWIPPTSHVSRSARKRARTYPRVRISHTPPPIADPPDLIEPSIPTGFTDSCVRIANPEPPRAIVRVTGPSTLRLSVPGSTAVQIWRVNRDRDLEGMVLVVVVEANRPVYLTFTAPETDVLVPYYGPFDLCPVGAVR